MIRPARLLPALLLLSAAAPALAQMRAPLAEAAPSGPVVTLSVTEHIDAAPDMATLSTGVETRAPTARAAMTDNAIKIDAVIKALLAQGIDRKDIQTSGINLNPQYDYSQRKEGDGPRFLGYQASNMLTVKLRRLDKAGETVDAMVNAGATNINGPNFGIADTGKLEDQAREKAVRTAAARAAAYARAAGYASARLLAISETGEIVRPLPIMAVREMALSAAPAPKIEPGTLSTSITLSFSYMLER
jgi:uncharacterized protein